MSDETTPATTASDALAEMPAPTVAPPKPMRVSGLTGRRVPAPLPWPGDAAVPAANVAVSRTSGVSDVRQSSAPTYVKVCGPCAGRGLHDFRDDGGRKLGSPVARMCLKCVGQGSHGHVPIPSKTSAALRKSTVAAREAEGIGFTHDVD